MNEQAGPNGLPRRDGKHPCQCFTCSACPEPTALTADQAAEWSDSDLLLCRKCLLLQHSTREVEPTKWTRPKIFQQPTVDKVEATFRRDRDAAADVEAKQRIFEEQENRFLEQHFGGRWVNASIDEYADPEALRDIEVFLEAVKNPSKGRINLVLAGTLGAGKTYLMRAIVRRMFDDRLVFPNAVRFGAEDLLLVPLVTGFSEVRDKHRTWLTDRDRVRAIFVDEAGRAAYSDPSSQHAAWDILADFAYSHDVPLVLATNMTVRPKTPSPARSGSAGAGWAGARDALAAPSAGSPAPSVMGDLSEVMSDAAYDRIITNTPRQGPTLIVRDNLRPKVASGDVPR